MGWERKRGKLHELNRLLRGATDTSFVAPTPGLPQVPPGVRYVITLDADTRLPRDAAQRLVGKMAHPLNRPLVRRGLAARGGRLRHPAAACDAVAAGRARRLAVPAPVLRAGGIDPYSAAASDIYQDLFAEGSYTGKGIYDVDAFEAALAGRVPANDAQPRPVRGHLRARRARVRRRRDEDYPSRYDVAARPPAPLDARRLATAAVGLRAPGPRARYPRRSASGKILTTCGRSLWPISLLARSALCWLLPMPAAAAPCWRCCAAVAIPSFLGALFSIAPRRRGIHLPQHARRLADDLKLASLQTFFALAFLADQAWRMADAIAAPGAPRHAPPPAGVDDAPRSPRAHAAGSARVLWQMAGGAVRRWPSRRRGRVRAASWPLVLPFAAAVAGCAGPGVVDQPRERRRGAASAAPTHARGCA
jgi:cyclic beta-1,2-glucan synthetase